MPKCAYHRPYCTHLAPRTRLRYIHTDNTTPEPDTMIPITDNITLEDDEIQESFIRSSGPGGQNVNKTSTGVQLRFNAATSPALTDYVRTRLLTLAGSRATSDGVIIITATEHRSQLANREEALARLVALIRQATERPKYRRPTRPSKAAKERRMEGKARRGDVKKTRGPVRGGDD